VTPAVGSSAQLEPTGLVALDRTESFVDRLGPPNVTLWTLTPETTQQGQGPAHE
jgi:hypothetical protein